MNERARVIGAALALVLGSALASTARADGDEAHSELLNMSGLGLNLTSVGVGLAGRRESGPDAPVTEGSLVLSTLPAGANVVAAHLYWVVYGTVGDDTVDFGTSPAPLTGTLIGTSAHTCWMKFSGAELNRTYRADVTATVTANATYRISGFPSGTATADTQGASLVVVYEDPADTSMGTVVVNDGSITRTSSSGTLPVGFATVATSSTLSATFRLGGGDGQPSLPDGMFELSDAPLPSPAGGHFGATSGPFWDDHAYDVTTRVTPGESPIPWGHTPGADCLVFVYAALSLRSDVVAVDAGAGGLDAGSTSPVDAGGSAAVDAGAVSRDAGGAATVDAGLAGSVSDEGGCGCRVSGTPASNARPPLMLAALGLAILFARGRARRREPR